MLEYTLVVATRLVARKWMLEFAKARGVDIIPSNAGSTGGGGGSFVIDAERDM
jgi:hypothetical protein